jgi:response regulator RpfG family c-di-GMP phosphodiesterase
MVITPQVAKPAQRKHSFRGVRPSEGLLDDLLASSLVLTEDWDQLAQDVREELPAVTDAQVLLSRLVDLNLLTEYQAARVEAGTTFGLILGNYRVLDRLGVGGMGVVFRAEHIRMRRQVAIKVLPLGPDQDQRILRRFLTEIRAIAQLQHPNIVAAFDAGEAGSPDANTPVLHFFVMEYVPGQDLEEYVQDNGPQSAAKACDLMHQVASALAEAHNHNLVHRDIKPSNIRITPEGQAKLLDFGLARHFPTGVTEPGVLLGTVDYMAPEQVQDAHGVDIRADLYALGGTLYWCLTGQAPFPSSGNIVRELTERVKQQPPSVRVKRPDVPEELDAVIGRLMALDPKDRYETPQAVMRALLPFLRPELRDHLLLPLGGQVTDRHVAELEGPAVTNARRILIVDDQREIRTFCHCVLQADGFQCEEADGGLAALDAAKGRAYDLIVLDIDMPDMQGTEVCRRLRENPPSPHLKILMVSGLNNADTMAKMLLAGADDFITKPFSVVQLQGRIKASLRLKDAQDRSDMLNQHLLTINHELEQSLGSRDSDLVQARNALVLALAKLVEHRASEKGSHLLRLQRYCRTLAEEASRTPTFAAQLDPNFIEMLECCAPLHDIGKVGLPDHILLKPGKLDPDERVIMQAHTLIGAETLQEVLKHHGSALAFLHTAIDITRHHHERFDGHGYPDRLAGSDIPLAARLVAMGDVYDALRSRRPYKPALSHNATLQVMTGQTGQFDPALMPILQRCAPQLERIFKELPD